MSDRPRPPAELVEYQGRPEFLPAPALIDWARAMFIDPYGALANEEHLHLIPACIGALWTNAPAKSKGRTIAGTAEMFAPRGQAWVKARQETQMQAWFGAVPDFVITLSAPYANEVDDWTFCALVEHELLHCAQAIDEYGTPKFRKSDGRPVYAVRGHDVEEFVSVVRRYGPDAAANVRAMTDAAKAGPTVAPADLTRACGTCIRLVA
jgi:hypothetical protein